jgi:hypothetical protein
MPKPLKKAAPKSPAKPRKPKRPSDPNQAAHAMMAEHMARLDPEPEPTPAAPLDFEAAYKAHMAKLGAKGGKVGGKRRLETMTEGQRKKVAKTAAEARWKNRKKDA